MGLPQSPPTTSGIVVITGSNFFDPQSSDFPIVRGQVTSSAVTRLNVTGAQVFSTEFSDLVRAGFLTSFEVVGLNLIAAQIFSTEFSDLVRTGFLTVVGPSIGQEEPPASTVGRVLSPTPITQTTVTTSGIVIMDTFVIAAEEFVIPIVINERIYPVFQGVFPEQNRRIFPVLPQFSILTPGD